MSAGFDSSFHSLHAGPNPVTLFQILRHLSCPLKKANWSFQTLKLPLFPLHGFSLSRFSCRFLLPPLLDLSFLFELSCSVAQLLSCVWLFVTPKAVAHQSPLSTEFFRQEYKSRLSFPPPGDLPDLGIEPASLMSPALEGGFFTTVPPWKPFSFSCSTF